MKKKMVVPFVASLAVTSLTGQALVEAQSVSKVGEVTSHSLTVRKGPSPTNSAIDYLMKGEKVNILNDGRSWDLVSYDNGKRGYVYDSYLKVTTKANVSATAVNGKGVVTLNSQRLNFRQGPSTSSKIVGKLYNGSVVDVYSKTSSWYYVGYKGQKGYVHSDYLRITQQPTTTTTTNQVLGQYTVNTYMLNVRQGASANHKIVGVLKRNQAVTLHSKSGDWGYITVGNLKGYVNVKYLKVASTVSQPATPSTPTQQVLGQYAVNTYSLNVRQGGSVNQKIVGVLKKNQTVTLHSKSGDWGYITAGSLKGYVNVKYLRPASSAPVTTTPTTPSTPVEQVTKVLTGKKITLDPGHGGSRPGAVANGLAEKTLTLDVALRLKAKLEQAGATVYMTRTTDRDCISNASYDADLRCRPAVAKNTGSDIFLSIHGNSGSSTAYGAETYYHTGTASKNLASAVQSNYINQTGLRNRNVKTASFSVLRNSTVPSALIELGFISNPSEAAKFKDEGFKNKAAEGLYKGIVDYFN